MLSREQKNYVNIKRIIDIIFSFTFIIVLSPFLLILLILSAIDSKGKPIFIQKRIGKNQVEFNILKFRSMKENTPNKGAEYLTEEESQSLTTRWGRFMRKTSLDELPQLFNILKGDMSFIGPRPGLTKEGEEELIQYRSSYLPSAYEVKPGLSGYSQIMLKRNHDVRERAKWDSFYVKHLSFFLDQKLFFISVFAVFGINRGK
jgi:O-antigen biosynthesis protein WbqP